MLSGVLHGTFCCFVSFGSNESCFNVPWPRFLWPKRAKRCGSDTRGMTSGFFGRNGKQPVAFRDVTQEVFAFRNWHRKAYSSWRL